MHPIVRLSVFEVVPIKYHYITSSKRSIIPLYAESRTGAKARFHYTILLKTMRCEVQIWGVRRERILRLQFPQKLEEVCQKQKVPSTLAVDNPLKD